MQARRAHPNQHAGRSGRLRPSDYRPLRDTAITAASFVIVSAAGAASSLLLVLVAGGGAATDAVVAAYSLFLIASLFAATIRPLLVPMFGSPEHEAFMAHAARLAGRVSLIGLFIGAGVGLLSPLVVVVMARVIPPSERDVVVASLVVLAPAGWLQIRAAAGSAIFATANRFASSALLYAGSALVALVFTAILLGPLGPIGLPLGALCGGVALAAGHGIGLRRLGIRVRPPLRRIVAREQWTLAGRLIVSSAIPLTVYAQLSGALPFVSPGNGEVTAYAYAYFLITAFLAAPAAISMVTLPRLVDRLENDPRGATISYAASVIPPALAVVAALTTGTIAFGGPIADWALAGSLGAGPTGRLMDVVTALIGFAIGNTLLILLWPLAASLRRERSVAVVAIASLVALVAGASAVSGSTVAVAIVQSCIAAGTAVAACLALVDRDTIALIAGIARRLFPAVLCVAAVAVLRALTGDVTDPIGAAALLAASLVAAATIIAVSRPEIRRRTRRASPDSGTLPNANGGPAER